MFVTQLREIQDSRSGLSLGTKSPLEGDRAPRPFFSSFTEGNETDQELIRNESKHVSSSSSDLHHHHLLLFLLLLQILLFLDLDSEQDKIQRLISDSWTQVRLKTHHFCP